MNQRMNAYGQPIGAAIAGWVARPRPERTRLSGKYCRLEPVDAQAHASDLFSAYAEAPDDRDWTYLFAARPQTEEQAREYLTKLAASEDPLHFTIVDQQSGKAVGTAALMRIDPAHGVIEVGSINYSPRLKQTPAGTEAMYLLMRYAFDQLGYRRYEWKCDSLNAPSRAAAARYGFTFEGIFRKAIVYKERNRDTAWYSIVDDEWPRVRAAFESWLDAHNFDERGRQKRSLSSMRADLAAQDKTLVAATRAHLKEMMAWFPTREACAVWSGPAFRFPFTEQTFFDDAKVAELPSFALVDTAGSLLGFGQYYLREGRCHFGRLAINPGFRSRGLGTRLVSLLASAGCSALGVEECSLFVSNGNDRAERLYERIGFCYADYPTGRLPLPNCKYMILEERKLSG
jgi:RimJ/RimL family protein N-acetyltransferase